MRSLSLGVALLAVAACSKTDYMPNPTPAPISQSFDFRLQDIFAGKTPPNAPMDLQAPPGDARLFIAERRGKIRIVQAGTLLTTPFLDISNRILLPFAGEEGLLSFAFHPQFANGQPFVFVHFIDQSADANGDIVVERYEVSSTDPNLLQTPGTEVIRIPHRDFNNHYGGRVAFGPDGMLYLSVGDGGSGGDPSGNGQNAATLLGKLLRLDVSNLDAGAVPPYAIPADNPTWPATSQARRENWAIGLRNPFRYAFDAPTGRLYIADVGQNAREEIDVVAANSAGLDYGWNLMEGMMCYPNGGQCNMTGLTLPVYDYDHSQGCAIIGGYVYRGTAIAGLQGQYLFSDLCSGFVRSLSIVNGVATVREASMVNAGAFLVQSFGQDGAGELYILTSDGRVQQIVKQ